MKERIIEEVKCLRGNGRCLSLRCRGIGVGTIKQAKERMPAVANLHEINASLVRFEKGAERNMLRV